MTTRHRITTSILVAAGLAASANSALATTFDINANGSYVPAGSPGMRTQATAPPPSQPTIVRVSAPAGFEWGDAGIGAAGGIALSMIGLGGALAVSQHRTDRTRGSAAPTN